ncbi:putative restriction endonuclease [Catalinimonas alkaloidigena]|uniref:Putative restriction endonuclease n=1 Tax=Catalinimonas alkaloidigena TaxID=1075417 RepID=A0A1G9A3P3_9BACT|nr:YDG/SRA domain-containing protein [Catalinimonas alkaloidigena]SDK21867.1 putative restriction endonuclease [Catalinimonas alkaloidigena]
MPGYPEGYEFQSRLELSLSGVHAPRQAGISGNQQEGADSVVISGGYEDDEDYGDEIIYTGHGGRDLNTGKQGTDQLLHRNNLALAKNCQTGLPVRVIRGKRPSSRFAPQEGYRYDGLFRVEAYWKERGRSGFLIWRFRLRKIEPPSVATLQEPSATYGSPQRLSTVVQRIVRDTAQGRSLKALYQFQCQVCGVAVPTTAGGYAEAAHIRPLGRPHAGPDVLENLLCLCPNHHVMLDFGGFGIADDFSLLSLSGSLLLHPKHSLGREFLQYHRDHIYQ